MLKGPPRQGGMLPGVSWVLKWQGQQAHLWPHLEQSTWLPGHRGRVGKALHLLCPLMVTPTIASPWLLETNYEVERDRSGQ